jgi:hypothetical protein
VVDWRKATEALLVKKGLSKVAWAELMKYARSLIPHVMTHVIESGAEGEVRKYARERYVQTILKMAGLQEVPEKTRSGYIEAILGVSMDAFIEAMLVVAVVLRSIYEANGLVQNIVCTDDELKLAKDCFDLFMKSYEELFGVYLVQGFVEAERGIQRTVM